MLGAVEELPGLLFLEEGHRYFLDGAPVTGCTTALKVISDADYRFVDPELMAVKARFGTAVHRVIDLDCLGQLDLARLDDDLVPYWLAWRDFLTASGFQVRLSEGPVCSRKWRCAGKLDLFGMLNGVPAVIDAKCVVTVMPATGPQTAAYEAMLRESRPDLLPAGAPCRRYALQLRPGADGGAATWRLVPFTNPADLRVFLSCLSITEWRNAK